MSVSCSRCGREWPRDPALEVECPTCGAPVGRRCQRPSQHGVFGNQLHPQRDIAAMAAGFLARCSAAPVQESKPGQGTLFEVSR